MEITVGQASCVLYAECNIVLTLLFQPLIAVKTSISYVRGENIMTPLILYKKITTPISFMLGDYLRCPQPIILQYQDKPPIAIVGLEYIKNMISS
jgi:hypothetical protein